VEGGRGGGREGGGEILWIDRKSPLMDNHLYFIFINP
jgi:hypothetical protein